MRSPDSTRSVVQTQTTSPLVASRAPKPRRVVTTTPSATASTRSTPRSSTITPAGTRSGAGATSPRPRHTAARRAAIARRRSRREPAMTKPSDASHARLAGAPSKSPSAIPAARQIASGRGPKIEPGADDMCALSAGGRDGCGRDGLPSGVWRFYDREASMKSIFLSVAIVGLFVETSIAGPVVGKLELPPAPERPPVVAKGFLDRLENPLAQIRPAPVQPSIVVVLEGDGKVETPAQ